MGTFFRLLARLPRLPLALAAAMLGIALVVEAQDPLPMLWLPKLPLAVLLAWAAFQPLRPADSPDPADSAEPANPADAADRS